MKNTKPTAIVTGAKGAIGSAIARQMAEKGYKVYVVARDENKARTAVQQIIDTTGIKDVDLLVIDLSRKLSIEKAAANWTGPLNILINNASCTPRQREETPEGIEMQFATNVLGYFWMIKAFTPYLKMAAPSRIVNVASYWAGDLDINDLECKNRHYNNDNIYRQSKQAERMLTVAFAERLKDSGITVNAVHPGDVNSKLSNNLGYGGHETPDQGADTPVWAATSQELDGVTGQYFERRHKSICRFGQDKILVNKLWGICEGY
jgi:NAD(P)-dependent dehydrogenase (short-subunit alcohol dehydrogenase family)